MNNYKNTGDNEWILKPMTNLLEEYQMRKSKLIKYVPTEKELKDATQLYKFILEIAEERDQNAIKLLEISNSISPVIEEQIKFLGFMNEVLQKYPKGEVPHQYLMDTAEKWDVLAYIVEDLLRIINIKLRR